MPRAFDPQPLGIDKNPLLNFVDLPRLEAFDPSAIFAGLLNACSNDFVTGLTALGSGPNNLVKLDTGIQTFIDALLGLLFCPPVGGITPQSVLESIGNLLTPIAESPFVQGLAAFADWLGRATGDFARDVFEGALAIADWFCGILTCQPLDTPDWPDFPAGVTTPFSIVKGVADIFGPIAANPFVLGIVAFANDAGVAVGNFFLDLFNGAIAIIEALCSLVTTGSLPEVFGSWMNTPGQIVDDIAGVVTALLDNPIVDGLRGLVEDSGRILFDTIDGALSFVTQLSGLLGNVSSPQEIITFLQGTVASVWELFSGGLLAEGTKTVAELADALTDWVGTIPLLADLLELIRKITGNSVIDNLEDGLLEIISWTEKIPAAQSILSSLIPAEWRNPVTGQPAGNWSDLASWAQTELMTFSKEVPAYLLAGDTLPQRFLANLPVGNFAGTSRPNLLADGGFSAATVLQAGNGWSWDGTQNYTGTTGGSAKVTCNGGIKRLFSNLIPVDPKQNLTLAVAIRWANLVSTGAPIILGIRTYNGAAVVNTTTLASRSNPGSSGGWSLSNRLLAEYVVPDSGVTAVRMMIGVTTASSGDVWFDDASMVKSGLLPQEFIDSLLDDLGLLTPINEFRTLLNTLGGKNGAAIIDVITRLDGFLTGNSNLNGDKITSGNIVTDRITDLRGIIATIYKSVTGQDLVFVPGQGSAAVAQTGSALSGQTETILGQSTAIQDLQNQLTSGVAVTDDFERSALGANWDVRTILSDGSTLGIRTGTDAFFDAPNINQGQRNKVTAIYQPKSSLSDYQIVSTTIGSAPGVPLLGPSGANDLLVRVAGSGTNLFAIIARVYGDGTVEILRRNGTWTETTIAGPTATGRRIVTGTRIDFFAGNRVLQDPTQFTLRINDATVLTGYYTSLDSFGKGWGFGMYNGISGLVPQEAGSLNFWAARDQL